MRAKPRIQEMTTTCVDLDAVRRPRYFHLGLRTPRKDA
jgi:hypothetical protein